MDDLNLEEWFKQKMEEFKNDPEFQAEIIFLLNERETEPTLRNEYDGD